MLKKKMKHWKNFNLLLLLVSTLICLGTPNCPKSGVENHKDASCICEVLDSSSNGWSYTCFDFSSGNPLFSVEYAMDKYVKFLCGEHEPQFDAILREIDLGEIQNFLFKLCSFPNASYSEIIPYRQNYPVKELRIESAKNVKVLTAELFGNLSETLKLLKLNNNGIESLSETLLTNFTQLIQLTLDSNRIRTLSNDVFFNTQNLQILEISNNDLEIIEENAFQNLRKLESLYLIKNKLKVLPAGLFKNLVSLKILDISDNNLSLLPDGIFDSLTNLIYLRLRGNKLTSLSETLLKNSNLLMGIDLDLNAFNVPLPKNLLFGLNELQTLSLGGCNLTEIPENFLNFSPNLVKIDFQSNSIVEFPNKVFLNNSMLKEINFNFNSIKELQRNLFPNQMLLEKIEFFKNNITVIPDGLFLRARKVKQLILGHNQVTNASQGVFRDLPYLEILDLSRNNLVFFKLDINENIKKIDLSDNKFTSMPNIQWTQHLKLESLNMERNNISTLVVPILYYTVNKLNPVLNFAHNNIKTVDITNVLWYDRTFIGDLSSKDSDNYVETRIVLRSNPFACDCHLYDFFDYIKRSSGLPKRSVRFDMVQNLTCQEPRNLSGKSLIHLPPSAFTCDIKNQCSSPCHCYFRAKDQATVVNCSYHGLESLPFTVPNNTNVLFFQKNLLTNMSEFDSEIWENLTELYLDKNQIVNLENWKIPHQLKNISLHGNNLRYLPSFLMNFISNAEKFQISLGDNPWSCNCSSISFKKWLAEHYQKVKDLQNIVCSNRMKLNGTFVHSVILTTPDDNLCPLDDWPYKLHLISVTVICVILALLLFIVSVLYYRNKQTVIAYVYIHMHYMFTCFFTEEDIDEDKAFDAFISYSSSDRDVALLLMEELENKEPRFQLCIHERNWIAGNQISVNIFNSVHKSKRTILIISREFLESMWFQVEFHTAYYQMLEDKIDRLIIIVKGDLPAKETMDRELQYLLSTKTYLIWEEKWFWEKLKYAMPHKKQVMLSNEVIALKDRPSSEKIKPVDNQIAILSASKADKAQEVLQNHSNSALRIVKSETPRKELR